MKGFYLSKWQGRQVTSNPATWSYYLDLPAFKAARPEFGFVYIKATQGTTSVDPLYEINRRKAEEAGYPMGVFHYFTNRADPIAQARHFYNVAGGRSHGLALLPSGDYEDPDNQTDPQLGSKIHAFMQETEALWGVRDLAYTRKTWWNPYVRKNATSPDPRFGGRLWWVAHYNRSLASPWLPVDAPNWAIWQIGEIRGGTYPGMPATITEEILNPQLTLADISFPPVAPDRPMLDGSMLYDNLVLMLQDFGRHGRVAPYTPIEVPG